MLCTYDFGRTKTESAQAFIERLSWQGVTASELTTVQSFIMDWCELWDARSGGWRYVCRQIQWSAIGGQRAFVAP